MSLFQKEERSELTNLILNYILFFWK